VQALLLPMCGCMGYYVEQGDVCGLHAVTDDAGLEHIR